MDLRTKKFDNWTLQEYETGAFTIPEGAETGMICGGCSCRAVCPIRAAGKRG